MSRSLRRMHLAWWIILGPVAVAILASALILKPARPTESYAPPNTGARP